MTGQTVAAHQAAEAAEVAQRPPEGPFAGRRDLAWVLALVVLSFFLRVWAPGPVTETYDERLWLTRTDQFIDAVKTGDFDHASASASGEVATMPGVTVMLAGSGGRLLAKAAGRVGLIDPVDDRSAISPDVLRAGRAVVALACAVALGLLVWMASRLVGRRAAVIAGVLVATEPFLVGQSDLLHTDALVAMYAALAVVAAMAAIWSAPDDDHVSFPLVCVSAAAAGVALLTKLNALPLLATAFAVIGVLELLRLRSLDDKPGLASFRSLARPLLLGAAISLGVVVVLWPALWTSPMTQLRSLWDSAHIAGNAGVIPTSLPYAERHWFVPITLAFRMTPWLYLGGIAAAVASFIAVVRRPYPSGWPQRRVVIVLLAAPIPYLVMIERSSRVFDRYLLPLWPFAALLIGTALAALLARHQVRPATLRFAAGAALMTLVAVPLWQAPYGSAFSNPLVGSETTGRLIRLGWGEGVEQLGHTIVERDGEQCHDRLIAIRYPMRIAVPCGTLVGPDANRQIPKVDYVIIEVRHRQRHSLPAFEQAIERGELIDRVTIDGISYAELWKVNG